MNIQKMLKQAQEMKAKMEVMQEQLANEEREGVAAGGAVKVVMSGKHNVKSLVIDKELIDPEDKETLEDSIIAALNDAKKKIDDLNKDAMEDATGGMKLPF